MEESWKISPEKGGKKKDLFHVIHKVPFGDGPYDRAKHVQVMKPRLLFFFCFAVSWIKF